MVGSEATDRRRLHRHHRVMDGGDGVELEAHQSSGSGVACSICLDLVSDDGERSRAKLHCGHEFHLDCIGSAFNMKGAMQCPNCRKVEKGQWLYANGSSCSLPEFNMEDWVPDEDPYDLSYTEMPFRVHWCPFGRLARLRSSFEEVEYPSTTYNGFPGHHALPSVDHSYIAYFRPVPSNSADSIEDPNLNHHWNGPLGHNEIFDPHSYPAIHNQHHNWGHHHVHANGADATQRSTHGESDVLTRFRPFPHPFIFGHGSGPGAGSSFVSSTTPHHPSSNARAFHLMQQTNNSHGMPSPMIPSIRRLDGQRNNMPAAAPPPAPLDHSSNFYVENAWEREQSARFLASPADRDSGWHSIWHRQWPWRS